MEINGEQQNMNSIEKVKYYIAMVSGGKDSLFMLLMILNKK